MAANKSFQNGGHGSNRPHGTNQSTVRGKGQPKCDYCGEFGHYKEKCYELVGYPATWNQSGSNKKASVGYPATWNQSTWNQSGSNKKASTSRHSVHNATNSVVTHSSVPTPNPTDAPIPGLSSAHYHQLLALLSPKEMPTANLAGKSSFLSCNLVTSSPSWILDSGASDHMTSSLSLLTTHTPTTDAKPVKLPTDRCENQKASMTPVQPKLSTEFVFVIADDVSLLMVLIDTNPFFWSAANTTSLSFSKFLSHVVAFLNSVLLLNQLNQVVVIATGINTCDYLYDSAAAGALPNQRAESLLQKLVEFVVKDEQLGKEDSVDGTGSSLLSGSLSMALCYIQRVFRSGPHHPQPRILCLHGSPDGPEQYVAIMNAIFSAQRSMVPIDSCLLGAQHSAFLQQASYITGGVYLKPQQLDGLFQYLSTCYLFISSLVLHEFHMELKCLASVHVLCVILRQYSQVICILGTFYNFLSLWGWISVPRKCFCHKNTIDMGYICSVCLSIFCKHHKNCSTCGGLIAISGYQFLDALGNFSSIDGNGNTICRLPVKASVPLRLQFDGTCISGFMVMGGALAAFRYQAQLQQNLTYLAAIADAQPQMYLLDTSNNLSQKRLSNNQVYTVDFVKSTWSKHYNASSQAT
ncbi:hypothetical protein RHGRI_031427 [Rhododendron griersonianum]|uniref:General transcription and DNA repair factor IIH subunit TFB4 n=1 Tax=Rhododendron griersonianum TaxID=479676 RepID=A0AAV6IDP5_9ERIC|nr:hypothetical protein RHGRI_031427 [Rhododendron griersonianum]